MHYVCMYIYIELFAMELPTEDVPTPNDYYDTLFSDDGLYSAICHSAEPVETLLLTKGDESKDNDYYDTYQNSCTEGIHAK